MRIPAIVMTVLCLAACGSSGSGPSGSAGGVKIGMSISTLNNPYFVQLRDGAQSEAIRLGAALTVTDAQNDASHQVNQVLNFTSQNMKAIIINPVDSNAAAPAVKAADRARIPVIAADRVVTGAEVAQTVASDNLSGGRMAAQELAQRIGRRGIVVVLQGTPGTSATNFRDRGFNEGIAAYPDVKVVARQPADFDRTKGLDVMTNLLQSHPDVTGVFAENDEMALGAIKALGSRAGKQVTVIGFDGTPEGLKAVQAGTMAATIAQQPRLLGQQAVDSAIKAANGETIKKSVAVPVKVADKENVTDFLTS
ncbi:substrate-binding domain-containing protein [Nonomuraea sp. NPDC050643]|uniref:substrate-binding domain-containing protein n=1 Tax=Nonomuraea sp. NPDC050643 TaxID=3155660 RepID=UPI0033E5D247